MSIFNWKVKLALIGIAICAVALFFSVSAALAAQNVSVRGGVSVTYKYYPSSTMSDEFFTSKIPEDVETITFDYYNAYKYASYTNLGAVDRWNTGLNNGGISMYQNGKDVYVLAKGEILAPSNCNKLFTYYYSDQNIPVSGYETLHSLKSITFKNFNTENVTDMSDMFNGEHSWDESDNKIEHLDLSSFNTSNVTNMSRMFIDCSSLISIEGLSNLDTSNVTNMQGMFYNCSSLTSVDLSNFNTLKVTNMRDMFNNCSNLTSFDLSAFNTSNVTTMEKMFSGCTSLESVDISSFTSHTSGVYIENMFDGCSSLTTLKMPKQMFSITSHLDQLEERDENELGIPIDPCSMFKGCSSLTSLDISMLDTTKMQDMSYMFAGCSSLTSLDLSSFNVSKVYDMGYMFSGCSKLQDINLSSFSVMPATNWLSGMFEGCSSLKELDLSSFNPSDVRTIKYMFKNCFNLVKVIVGPSWELHNFLGGDDVFYGCTSIIGPAGTAYDPNKVSYAYACVDYKYDNGTKTQQGYFYPKYVDISKSRFMVSIKSLWEYYQNIGYTSFSIVFREQSSSYTDTVSTIATNARHASIGEVANRYYSASNGGASMYVKNAENGHVTLEVVSSSIIKFPADCSSLMNNSIYMNNVTLLDFSKNIDTSNVTNMFEMFYGCRGLTSLDLSNFNTSNVTNMCRMFYNCSSLTEIDVSSFDTSKVTGSNDYGMSQMFDGCSSLTSLDLSSFDISNVESIAYMFDGCSSLTSLDLSSFDTSNVTDMSGMFSGCSSLTSLDLSSFDTSNVTSMGGMFYGCSSLTSLDLSSFDTSKVGSANSVGMSQMFDGCSSLTSLDLSSFDTSKVTNMNKMFYGCSGLTSLDVSNFTVDGTDAIAMFSGCSSLTYLDVSHFKPIYIHSMFEGCTSLETVDVFSRFTSGTLLLHGTESDVFKDCTSLRRIYVDGGGRWDLGWVETDMQGNIISWVEASGVFIFQNCYLLYGEQSGMKYDPDKISGEYANVSKGYFSVR